MIKKIKNVCQTICNNIRQLSGDDAYERYLAHFTEHQQLHAEEITKSPLSRKAFFKQWQDSKWKGIKRCC